jgi:predicted PurR-regulated permease PerM
MSEPVRARPSGSSRPSLLLTGIFLILLTAALRLGAGLLIPIAIAGMFTLLLDPPVRALRKLGVPTTLGAALVVFGTLAVLGGGAVVLAGPASDWIEGAPKILTEAQTKVRRMLRPIQETARQVEQATQPVPTSGPPPVQIRTPGLLERLSVSTTHVVVMTISIVFLTFFQLAMLPRFRKKLAHLIGDLAGSENMETVLAEVESQMSRYVLLNTVTRAGVGVATWAFLAAAGLSGAILWGVATFFLSFIPYAGALAVTVLIGVAALVSFDSTAQVLLVVGGIAGLHLVEGNFVTPHLMGRHLPLNPVAIFLGLLYWGWVWGPVGALLAVPIMVMLQVIFSRISALRPIAVLLDS